MNELKQLVSTYEELKDRVGMSSEDIKEVISMARSFEFHLKDDIVMFCYAVCTADNELDKEEYKFIQQLRA